MRPDVLEAVDEERFRLAIKKAGGLCIKLPPHLYIGIPDRLVLLPGARVFFVELKRRDLKKGRTSVAQERFREILSRLGFTWVKINGKSEVDEFVRTHVES